MSGLRLFQVDPVDVHGTQNYAQASDGTGTSGHLAQYNDDGSLTDSTLTVTAVAGGLGTWVKEIPAGSLDGSNKVFTLTYTPIAGSLELYVNIVQSEGTDFTISGNTITFAVAPKARDSGWFLARYQH